MCVMGLKWAVNHAHDERMMNCCRSNAAHIFLYRPDELIGIVNLL